jgi:hypothetical protein
MLIDINYIRNHKKLSTMKQFILGACMVLAIFSTSAQDQQSTALKPEEMAVKRVDKLKCILELNSMQQEIIQQAMVLKLTKSKEIREQNAGNPEAMKQAMEPVRLAFVNTMKSTLSEEQFNKWKSLQAEKIQHRKNKMQQAKVNREQPKQLKHGTVEPKQTLEDK